MSRLVKTPLMKALPYIERRVELDAEWYRRRRRADLLAELNVAIQDGEPVERFIDELIAETFGVAN